MMHSDLTPVYICEDNPLVVNQVLCNVDQVLVSDLCSALMSDHSFQVQPCFQHTCFDHTHQPCLFVHDYLFICLHII